MRHPDGTWAGYTYEWNAQRTDATLRRRRRASATRQRPDLDFPSEAQCLQCHTERCGPRARPGDSQLNRDFTLPADRSHRERARDAELTSALLTPAITQSSAQRRDAGSGGYERSLEQIARALTCTPTARNAIDPAARRRARLDLRYTTALNATNACNVAPPLGRSRNRRERATDRARQRSELRSS